MWDLCSSTNYPTEHNPSQTQLSVTLSSTLFFFPPYCSHSLFSSHAIPSFFIYFLHPCSSVAHQLQQLAEVTPAGIRMHAGGVQLTDRAQSVLAKPAYNLRRSDSQAPLGLTVAGVTWLNISCTSCKVACCLPVTFLSKFMSMDRQTGQKRCTFFIWKFEHYSTQLFENREEEWLMWISKQRLGMCVAEKYLRHPSLVILQFFTVSNLLSWIINWEPCAARV